MRAHPLPSFRGLFLPIMKTFPDILTRRSFLRTATAASLAAPLVLRSSLRGASPNGKLQHACIGVGGMGANDLENFRQHPRVEVVAICDVDENALKAAAAKLPGARAYRDWRELLDKEGGKIDSVNLAVPDHMHFSIAFSAIQRGKHVYCQKPMCHDVAEVRALTEAAAKAKIVSQLGTQMAATAGERTAVRWLQDGVIGKVNHAYLCSNRPGAVEQYRLAGPRPAQGQPPPATLDWDLWIGTAPQRPFAPDIYAPVKWRAWQDFGTGWSGDIGCHIFDAVWKGLKMQPAKSVVAEVQPSWQDSPARRGDTWPQGDHITWLFPGNPATDGKDWELEWFDGEYYPPKEIRALYSLEDYPPESLMVTGSEGALLYGLGSTPMLFPEAKFKDVGRPKFENRNHYHHFAEACLGGELCESHFGQTGPMTEAILLGTVAIRTPGKKLEWEAAAMKFPNAPEAEKLLRRTYRDGWHVANF